MFCGMSQLTVFRHGRMQAAEYSGRQIPLIRAEIWNIYGKRQMRHFISNLSLTRQVARGQPQRTDSSYTLAATIERRWPDLRAAIDSTHGC